MGWSRRTFLAAGAAWSALLFGIRTVGFGQDQKTNRTELMSAIRSLYGDPADAAPTATAAAWDLDRAAGVLSRGGAPRLNDGLRQQLGERIRSDFVDDRIQLVARRWLSDTEIAIAVVLAAKPL